MNKRAHIVGTRKMRCPKSSSTFIAAEWSHCWAVCMRPSPPLFCCPSLVIEIAMWLFFRTQPVVIFLVRPYKRGDLTETKRNIEKCCNCIKREFALCEGIKLLEMKWVATIFAYIHCARIHTRIARMAPTLAILTWLNFTK